MGLVVGLLRSLLCGSGVDEFGGIYYPLVCCGIMSGDVDIVTFSKISMWNLSEW